MKIKVENKVTVLSDTLKEFFGDNMDLGRTEIFGLSISSLCQVKTVCWPTWSFLGTNGWNRSRHSQAHKTKKHGRRAKILFIIFITCQLAF
jgi:hypothetical protein